MRAPVFQSKTVFSNLVLQPLRLLSLLVISEKAFISCVTRFSTAITTTIILLLCQIFGQRVYWFLLTHTYEALKNL